MHFDYTTSIINIAVMAVHAFAMLVAAALIFIKHKDPNDRSKSFIFAFFATSAIVAIGEISLILQSNHFLDHYTLMPPQSICMSGITFFLLLCYFIEVIRPHWLTFKRFIGIISPWLLIVGATVFFYIKENGHTHVYSFDKLSTIITYP